MKARKLFRWVHLYVGLAAGLLLILAGLTGSLLVFRPELDALLYPGLFRVEPGGERASFDEVLAAVREAQPDAEASYVRMPLAPDEVYEVWTDGEVGPLVYVDPYRATVLGSVMPDETLTGFLFQLHVNLLSGRTGELVMGYTALVLVLLCVTGVVLWWPSRRRLRGFRVKLRTSWKRTNYDLHRAGGIWTLVFVLVVAVTGASLIFPQLFQAGLNRLTASEPAPAPPTSVPRAGAAPPPLDRALETARRALPGAAVTWVYLPTTPEATLAVRMRLPGELQPNGRSYVYLDRYTGEVLHVHNALEAPAGSRIYDTLYPLHIGHFAGEWMRWLYALLGLSPAMLAVTGALIWWVRRRRRRPAAAPLAAPPARAPGRRACPQPDYPLPRRSSL